MSLVILQLLVFCCSQIQNVLVVVGNLFGWPVYTVTVEFAALPAIPNVSEIFYKSSAKVRVITCTLYIHEAYDGQHEPKSFA